MCGIVGFVADNPDGAGAKRRADALTAMWLAAQARGRDAAGLAVITPDGEARVIKDAISASRLVNHKRTQEALARPAVVVLGHTRFATIGDRDDRRNAHPFKAGDLVGVHNGTMRNAEVWAGVLHLPRFGQTDSEVAIRMFAREVVGHRLNAEDAANVAGRIEGNSAFALVDLRDPETVYLLANSEVKNLHYVHNPRLGGTFFASTVEILAAGVGYRVAFQAKRVAAGSVVRINRGVAKVVARFEPTRPAALVVTGGRSYRGRPLSERSFRGLLWYQEA